MGAKWVLEQIGYLDSFFNEQATLVARAEAEKLDAWVMQMYHESHRLYLLPPPALRSGCPAGNVCGEETFHTLQGYPMSIFVPEAGCPVHDPED